MFGKKKGNTILKIIFSSSILTASFFVVIAICVMMILNFFGAKITLSTIDNNYEYSDEYQKVLNTNLKNGYVPLARILYFYLEDDTLTFDEIYKYNINTKTKILKSIESVCKEERLKNLVACTESNIKDNKEFLEISNQYFNFPLADDYTITSYYNQERIIFEESDRHNGWDFAVDAETPIYSVCKGRVEKIVHTQEENVSYDVSGNSIGNTITLKCDEDYGETFYVLFAHIYPNSFKVKVGDKVNHYTEIAKVGTTGYSTGNHLHYQVYDSEWNVIDGMQLVDLSLIKYNLKLAGAFKNEIKTLEHQNAYDLVLF